jgi:hypothetical protein
MKPKPFCFHSTEGANNHIEQGDPFLFARHTIGVAYNQLPAMLADAIHIFPSPKNMAYQIDLPMYSRSARLIDYKINFWLATNKQMLDRFYR